MMPNIMGNITITINFSYLQFEIYNEKSDKANAYLKPAEIWGDHRMLS